MATRVRWTPPAEQGVGWAVPTAQDARDCAVMLRALKLARRGRGRVEPNPMVGACVVRSGRIIGEGYHHAFGKDHGEVVALREAGGKAKGATLYVTLEPCCHQGKTPPCTRSVIASDIKRVVVAMRDPFPAVRGKGIAALRRAGIQVDVGCCQAEARRLNVPYIKLRTEGIPYFTAKWAMTIDGRIATVTGESKWISSEQSRRYVHRLRSRADAVVIGAGTAIADDPELTARSPRGRNPVRVVLDSRARLPLGSRLVRTAGVSKVIVAVSPKAPDARIRQLSEAGCEIIVLSVDEHGRINLSVLARELGRREMTNVLIEGGAEVFASAFECGLVDRVVVFVAPVIVGGTRAKGPVAGAGVERIGAGICLEEVRHRRIGSDVVIEALVDKGATT